MFYFEENVIDLKAWQLYLGNAFWTLFIGLFLLVLAKLLGLVGLDHSVLGTLVQKASSITHARDPNVLLNWQQGHGGHPHMAQEAHQSHQVHPHMVQEGHPGH
jgi:hypothetical protein